MEEKELTWYDKHISYSSLTLPIRGPLHYSLSIPNLFPILIVSCQKGPTPHAYVSMVSCQKGPTRHAYAWQIGPFWQDTLDMQNLFCL